MASLIRDLERTQPEQEEPKPTDPSDAIIEAFQNALSTLSAKVEALSEQIAAETEPKEPQEPKEPKEPNEPEEEE